MGMLVGLSSRLRALRSSEGFSLLEVLMAMFIMSIVVVVFGSVFASVLQSVSTEEDLSQSNDEARLAIQQLDRELRSGNVLYDPASESDAGYMLRIYTQTNAPVAQPRCVLWRINSSRQLQTRAWPPLQPGNATQWSLVADGIVNKSLSPAVQAFSLDTDPNRAGRTINVTLKVNSDLTNQPTRTATIKASLTGRNTSFGYPQDVCSVTPS
jgi:prepilin-type N-terminal cleavage/methylation domain-containing protein